MTPPKIHGYCYRLAVNRAQNANRTICESLRRLVEETPGPQRAALLVARAGTALAENMDALQEISEILSAGGGARRPQ